MSDAVRISETFFDPTAAWAALTPAQQVRIGAAALDLCVARAVTGHAPDPAYRAALAIEPAAEEALQNTFQEEVPEAAFWSAMGKGVSTIRLPESVGAICLVCGCTEHDACIEGCSWHSHCLCTACSGSAAPPKSLVHAVIQARLVETSHRIRDQRGLPRLRGEEILGRATPAPDLAPEDARAICKGACRAVSTSALADVPPPTGDGLAAIASLIDRMHEDEHA